MRFRSLRLEPLEDRALLAAGDLDVSFGTGGIVVTDFGGSEQVADAVLQDDGGVEKIVVAGATGGQFLIARYNPDGSLDDGGPNDFTPGDSFGTGGFTTTAFPYFGSGLNLSGGQGMALQADGKIVVAGIAPDPQGEWQFALARYDADGTLDPAFGAGGLVTANLGQYDAANAVAVHADGEIVVAGEEITSSGDYHWHVARFSSTGIFLDSTSLPAVATGANDLAIQPDEKIVVAGAAQTVTPVSITTHLVSVRYNRDLTLDATFGAGGHVLENFGYDNDRAAAVVVQPDGRIVVAGSGITTDEDPIPYGSNFEVVRYDAGGNLDPTFASSFDPGRTWIDFQRGEDLVYDVALAPDGTIVLVGESAPVESPGSLPDFALVRLAPDGSVDPSFTRVTTDVAPGTATSRDRAIAVVIQSDGNLVVAGTSDQDVAVARYHGVAPVDSDGDGLFDHIEDAVNPSGDGDGDGTADRDQREVASFPNAADGQYVTLKVLGMRFRNVRAVDTSPRPGDVTFPVGGFEFEIERWSGGGLAPDATATVEVFLPPGVTAPATYFNFGATATDRASHWYEFAFDGSTGARTPITGNQITVQYVNGQRGDDDFVHADRFITRGGPAVAGAPSGSAVLSGVKFLDVDGDGQFDVGETGLPDWPIYLDENFNGRFDPGEPGTTTDEDGWYTFAGLERRTYQVIEYQRPGWTQTYPSPFVPAAVVEIDDPLWTVTSGDLDGDGLPDLVAVTDWEMEIHLSADGRQFNPPSLLWVGDNPEMAILDDFNKDGKLDMAVAVTLDHKVVVLLGNGDGAFTAPDPSSYPMGPEGTDVQPYFIDAADLDDDGNLDLLAVNLKTDNVAVLWGRGNGTFDSPAFFGVGDGPHSAAIGQLNPTADNFLDLAVTAVADDAVTILLGDGSRGFAPPEDASGNALPPIPVGTSPRAIVAGQFVPDPNDYLDLAVVNQGSDDLTILRGDGTGSFFTASLVPVGDRPGAIAATDFDGDGQDDLLVANASDNTVTWLQGQGALPLYVPQMDFTTGIGPRHVATDDLDGDGQTDVLVANHDSRDVALVFGSQSRVNVARLGDSSHVSGLLFGNYPRFGGEISGLAWNDANGDGVRQPGEPGVEDRKIFLDLNSNGDADFGTDLVTWTDENGSYEFANLPPDTYRVYQWLPQLWEQTHPGGDYHEVGLDPNEVVTGIQFGSRLPPGEIHGTKWNDLNGNGARDPGEPGLVGWTIYVDFNHNGQLDAGEPSTVTDSLGEYGFLDLPPNRNYPVGELLQPGWLQTFPQPTTETPRYAAGDGPDSVALADLDGDGDLDAAVANVYSDDVSVLRNLGDGTFAHSHDYPVGNGPRAVVAADLDGDGDPDLAVANAGSNSLSLLTNNGRGVFSHRDVAVGAEPIWIVAADLDGGSGVDLAVVNTGSDNVTLLFNDGAGSFPGRATVATGERPVALVAEDLDDDGDVDLAVANLNPSDQWAGTVTIHKRAGPQYEHPLVIDTLTLDPAAIVATDTDQDGDLDLLVAGSAPLAGGHVDVLLNGGSADFTLDRFRSFEYPAVSILVADLAGDAGVLDRVVTTPSSMITLVGSIGTSGSTYLAGPGAAAAAAGDLDGDGDVDLIVANRDVDDVSVFRNHGDGNFDPLTAAIHDVWCDPGDDVRNVDFGNFVVCTIRGTVWKDLDGNGQRDGSDSGHEGVSVYTDANENRQFDSNEFSAMTDSSGVYELLVPVGSYTVAEVVPAGFRQSFPASVVHTVDVAAGGTVADVDFGNRTCRDVTGIVWNDGNGNGLREDDEAMLPDSCVYLDLNQNGRLDPNEPKALTDSLGVYRFLDREPGTYSVALVTPEPWLQTYPGQEVLLSPLDFASPVDSRAVVTGHLNPQEDDYLDIVRVLWERVEVHLGNGDGTFQPVFSKPLATDFVMSSPPAATRVFIANLNAGVDSHPDVLVEYYSWKRGFLETEVLLGDGRGSLADGVWSAPGVADWIAAVDVGNLNPGTDDYDDIVVFTRRDPMAEHHGTPAVAYVLLGNDDATFQSPVSYVIEGPLYHVDEMGLMYHDPPYPGWISDLDDDGNPDLVVSTDSGNVTILPGNGDGTFGSAIHVPVAPELDKPYLGDLDGDGLQDLVVWAGTGLSPSEGGTLALLNRSEPGRFDFHFDFDARLTMDYISHTQTRCTDVNGDGRVDPIILVAMDDLTTYWGMLYLNVGDAGVPQFVHAGLVPFPFSTGDFQRDGDLDILTVQQLYLCEGLIPRDHLVTVEAIGPASADFGVVRLPDRDSDGISSVTEDVAPNGGDGNNDGTPDSQQENVTSLPNAVDGSYVTLISPSGTTIRDARAVGNPDPGTAPGVSFPFGFFDFVVEGVDPSVGYVDVDLVLHAPLDPRNPYAVSPVTYYKYGPTPNSPVLHWYEFPPQDVATLDVGGATRTVITLRIPDGGLGDHDLTVNGEVHDPGGPAIGVANVQAVVRGPQSPLPEGPRGEADSLPDGLEWIDEWDSFWTEIWASTPYTTGFGVADFSVDLAYDTECFTATDVQYGPAFIEDDPGWGIDDDAGLVANIRGAAALDNVGDERYLLLARVLFAPQPYDAGVPHNSENHYPAPVTALGIDLTVGHVSLGSPGGRGNVAMGDGPATELWPVIYDIDDDGRVGFGDLAFFATAFQQQVGDPGAPFAWSCDFDHSARVDVGDLAFLAENFQRAPGDPIVYPGNFPDDWQTGPQQASALAELAVAENLRAAGRASLNDSVLEAYSDRSDIEETPGRLPNDVLRYACCMFDFDRTLPTSSSFSDTKDVSDAVDFLIANGCW